jgi:hypothetical protein
MKIPLIICMGAVAAFTTGFAWAQKSGQSITITYGKVINAKSTQVSSAAGGGALVGGTIGLLASSGKSTSKKVRNAALGAAAGGVTASAAQGDRSAREYTVETGSGITVIISDQTEIAVGDCVIVENAGTNKANIRRVTQTYCDPDSAEVVAELQDEVMEEAEECLAAKQELVDAQTDDAFDRAIRKIEILCNS